MEIAHYKSRLQQLIAQRNGYLVLAAALAVISLILVICVCRMVNRERIVIVPPVIQASILGEFTNRIAGIFISNIVFSRAITFKHDAE